MAEPSPARLIRTMTNDPKGSGWWELLEGLGEDVFEFAVRALFELISAMFESLF